jgi:hypothetical protein
MNPLRRPSDSGSRRYALSVVSVAGRSVGDKGDDKGHSGRLLLRMPRTLHADLARVAEQRGISLNQLIVALLSDSLTSGAASPTLPVRGGGETEAAETARAQRRLGVALAVNLIVLVLAGTIAIALLIVAWSGGF